MPNQPQNGSEAPRRKHRQPIMELPAANQMIQKRSPHGKISAPVHIALIVGALASLGLYSLFSPKPEISAFENRTLAKKPEFSVSSLLSGAYVQGLESYYSDTFPLRETLVRAAAKVEDAYGMRMDDVRIYNAPDPTQGQTPLQNPAPSADPKTGVPGETSSNQEEAPLTPPEVEDTGEAGENLGSFFSYRGRVASIFSPNNAGSEYYANTLNAWQETLGPEYTIYNLVIPTQIEFMLPPRLQSVSAPQKPNIDYIYSLLNPLIKPVDAYTKLSLHSDEYIYFASDHHWTGLGAYYAYTAFCETAGFDPVPLDQMEKRTRPDFIGSLYAQTQDASLLENPDHVDYWMISTPHEVVQYHRGNPFTAYPAQLLAEHASGSNSYSVFLAGDWPLTKVTTSLHTGRKIAVVKESFGNAFAPFLVNHYDEVHVVDQRYFQLNLADYLRENEIHELLFINNIYAANTSVRIRETERLMTQHYVPPAPEPEPEPEPVTPPEPPSSSSSRKEFDPWADEFPD